MKDFTLLYLLSAKAERMIYSSSLALFNANDTARVCARHILKLPGSGNHLPGGGASRTTKHTSLKAVSGLTWMCR